MTESKNTTFSHQHDLHLDRVFGTVSLLTGILGLFGNAVIVKILLKHRKSLSAKIFLAIAYNDIITSLFGAVPFSIPRLVPHEAGLFGVPALCNLSGSLLNISERYSVFLIAVLSVTRACALKYPLLHIKQGRVLVLMLVYFVIQTSLACLPFFQGKSYYFDEVYTVCTWTLDDIINFDTQYIWYQFTYHILLFIPFFLPSIFVVTSCVFCVLSLRTSIVNNNDKNKAKASMTIVLFTITYIVLHVPIWIFLFLFLVSEHGKLSVDMSNKLPLYLFIFSSKVSVFINAALNPLIYMGRTKSLKHSFKEDVVKTATVRISQIRRSMVRRKTTNTEVVELKNKEDKVPSYADENARVFDEEGNALIAVSKA
ncbi:C-X-C chemokine receptor type 3-like [Bolinopsis microptera]|uniref:C-X-C chemokine receptor type 3-like n=1 Tax=Bolinopsis microptera TaxID=2820187 RepID=UPI0030798CB5